MRSAPFRRIRNCFAAHSVLREFLKSAKSVARTFRRIRNRSAPHSVLREFLKSSSASGKLSV